MSFDGTTVEASTSRKNSGFLGSRSGRYSKPGYQVFASVNALTGAAPPNALQTSAYGVAGLRGTQARNG